MVTRKTDFTSTWIISDISPNLPPDLNLLQKSKSHRLIRRKVSPRYSRAGVRFKREKVPYGKRSTPEIPILHWKFDEREKEQRSPPEIGLESCRDERGREKKMVASTRKLAALLWRLQLLEVPPTAGRGWEKSRALKKDPLGFQFDPTFQIFNSAMEGATKWDPLFLKTSDVVQQIYGYSNHLNERVNAVSALSAMEVEFEHAQARIRDLETEKLSPKKKLEHFLKKLREERAVWRNKEHEKIRTIIDDIKADLNWERKNCQRLEVVNSKLVKELTDAKLSAKRYMQEYEKQLNAREVIEEVCDGLVKEIGEDKAEVEELKRESMKLREGVDDERKMLQMAEVWREERVQMKLMDAKVMIEEKYSQMKNLVADLQTFLISTSGALDVEELRKAEFLRRAAISVNMQDVREFKYEAPNPDDILSVFNFGGSEIEQSDDEEDESGWETATHPEDHGSSYSPNWSHPSVNKIRRCSSVSESRTEWKENGCEGTPVTEIREVCTAQKTHLKKVSRLWKSGPHSGENIKVVSVEGTNGRLSSGRLSSGVLTSPDRCSGNGGTIPTDFVGQWSSPESGNPHITTRGCIEWPRGMQKSSLKAKLMDAKIDSQKIQLKQVLKQKI